MNDNIRVTERPQLNNAIMIIGLDGWGNGGEISTYTIKYLVKELRATQFGEILSKNYYNYLIQRPMVTIEEGVIQSFTIPKNILYYWKNNKGESDLVLLLGSEPHQNWSSYVQTLLRLAIEMNICEIYTVGGYLADISLELEPPISVSTNKGELLQKLGNEVELTNYTGPTSVYSEIMWSGKIQKLSVISLWCAVPASMTEPYSKGVHSILQKIKLLISMDIDLTNIETQVEAKRNERIIQREGVRQFVFGQRLDQGKNTTYIS